GANDQLYSSHPSLELGTHFIDLGGGRSTVDLTSLGISSQTDGVLLVTGGKNEDNFALSMANADGTWTIFCHDNGVDGTDYEQDYVAFVYVPIAGNPAVIAGKFMGDASVAMQSRPFTVTNPSAGTYRLTIPGYSPSTGVLIISAEGGVNYNVDNVVSYQANGDSWDIQTRDLTATGLQNINANEAVVSFAFIPAEIPPGITVTPTTGLVTTENGGAATFTVQLDSPPTTDVTIALTSSDLTEGTVWPASLTFTATNWYQPQTVTVTGQSDSLADGAVPYTIVLAPAVSADPDYDELDPSDVSVVNAALHNVAAAMIDVVQHDAGDTTGSVTVTAPLAINDFRIRSGSTRGDYNVQVGSAATDDITAGILLTSVTENGRNNDASGDTQGLLFATSSVHDAAAGYYVPVYNAPGRAEWNTDVAAAWFPYAAGWLGGLARNSTRANGGVNNVLIGHPSLVLGTHFIDLGGGQATVDLRSFGINSQTDGVLIVSHGKDEGNYALARANADGTWTVFVHDNGVNGGSYEQDPVAFVYVPKSDTSVVSGKFLGTGNIAIQSGPFTVAHTGTGTYQLTIPGYTPSDGVLIISAEGGISNNADNIVTYQASGDGWQIQTRDLTGMGLQNNGSTEAVASFVFIPSYGFQVTPTSGLRTSEDGGAAIFTVMLGTQPTADVTIGLSSSNLAEGTVSPPALTFTPDNWNWPQTVTVVGRDDGLPDGDVPYTIVLAPAVSADPNYDGRDPSDVSVINAAVHHVAAALIDVVQNDTGNTPASVTVTAPLAINDFRIRAGSNRGDINVQVGPAVGDDITSGILLTSVAENGRDNGEASPLSGLQFATSSVHDDPAGYFIPVNNAPNASSEWNIDVAAAWFPYAAGWLGALVRNSARTNGGANDMLIGHPSLVLGTHFIDLGGGQSTVDLRSLGIHSQTDGVLIVNHGKNEGNYALARVNADGTWTVFVHDNGVNGGSYERDPVAFVYVPKSDTSVVSGKFLGTGNIAIQSGPFTVAHTGTGTYQLTIPGYTPSDGVLIISAEGGISNNADNIVTYQPNGDGWQIQTRDLNQNPPTLQNNGAAETVASFVFIPSPYGFRVTPTSGLVTTESGGTATFTVMLDTKPTADVTIGLSSNDLTEATVSPATLTFTPANWNTPQTVTITGQDDTFSDGAVPYTIVLAPAVSTDLKYNGRDPSEVSVVNVDNEAGIAVLPTAGLVTTEAGGQDTFRVRLNTQPSADVRIDLSCDATAGLLDASSLAFTSANW
ncbi:MAG TPA: hypothetical protein PLF81_25900, partial [Candidatus Anammoximicrobium sp.]|nr:hypothetical protein [Candidatus Anammoximicrobium sp.]